MNQADTLTSCQSIFEDLFEAQELQNGEIDYRQ